MPVIHTKRASREERAAQCRDLIGLQTSKSPLIYNEFLTLEGIPPETFAYRLGNPDRSGLKWVIDQYQVSTDKRSGITNDRNTKSTPHPDPLPVRGGEGKDPNRPDDPEYIVRLLGQVITVSAETVRIVKSLPSLEP